MTQAIIKKIIAFWSPHTFIICEQATKNNNMGRQGRGTGVGEVWVRFVGDEWGFKRLESRKNLVGSCNDLNFRFKFFRAMYQSLNKIVEGSLFVSLVRMFELFSPEFELWSPEFEPFSPEFEPIHNCFYSIWMLQLVFNPVQFEPITIS
jgi:hypothetical protein